MGRVVVLGSINVDLVTEVDRHPRPGETVLGNALVQYAGGKGANQAVAAAAAGADVAMIGCVGDDAGGRAYLERLQRLGIDVSAVRTVPGASGHALVAVADSGENAIIVSPGANELLDEREVAALADLGAADVLLLQLEVPHRVVCTAARRAASAGARVVLNLAPYAGLPADVVALADPVVANELEAAALAESGTVASSVLVTFGANGVSWDGRTWPAQVIDPGDVVDTTGAGDAFCGALAAAFAGGAGQDEAVAQALAAGAEAVCRRGAQPDPEL